MAIKFGEIEPITYDKMIGYIETDVVAGFGYVAIGLLVEQYACGNAQGLVSLELPHNLPQRFSCVQNVVDEEHVFSFDINPDRIDDTGFRCGSGASHVAGNTDTIKLDGNGDVPDEVRGKQQRPVDDGDENQFPILIILGNLASQFGNPLLDSILVNENRGYVLSHVRWDAGNR